MWRTSATWIASLMVPVGCMFTALLGNSTRVCNICCLCTLLSLNNIQLHSPHLLHCKGTSWDYSLWQSGVQIHLPWCHSNWWNHIHFLHWTILLFPKPSLGGLCCSHWKAGASRCCPCEGARAVPMRMQVVPGLVRAVLSAEKWGAAGSCPHAHGCSDGNWARSSARAARGSPGSALCSQSCQSFYF